MPGYLNRFDFTFDTLLPQEVQVPQPIRYVRIVDAPIGFMLYAGHGTSTPIADVRAGATFDISLIEPIDKITFVANIIPALPYATYNLATILVSASPNFMGGANGDTLQLAAYDTLGQIRSFNSLGNANQSGSTYLTPQNHRALVEIANAILLDPLTTITSIGTITNPVAIGGVVQVRNAEKDTYGVIGRASTRVPLQHVYAGAGSYEWLTIWHSGSSARKVTILSIQFALVDTTVACNVTVQVNRLNSPQPLTGNPALTPALTNPSGTNAEVETLALPTTQGTEGNTRSFTQFRIGITPAAPAVNPPADLNWIELAPQWGDQIGYRPLEMDAGTAGGWVVAVDVSAATTIDAFIKIVLTEE